MQPTDTTIRYLFSTAAVRERCSAVFDYVNAGHSDHFRLEMGRLKEAAGYVLQEIKSNYPDLKKIPYHSRWQHFEVAGDDRAADLKKGGDDCGRTLFDLVIPSILLDAGAGSAWKYTDATGKKIGKSEGLAIASLDAFRQGYFSAHPDQPMRADGRKLIAITASDVAAMLQVTPENPMVGLEGRTALLQNLGKLVGSRYDVFGDEGRLGNFFEYLRVRHLHQNTINAHDVLMEVLTIFGAIWPGRISLGPFNLGDTWNYDRVTFGKIEPHVLPFHKLSQWMTYSLLEPFEWSGVKVLGVEQLTGLPEYRNGGLFVDLGVIVPKSKKAALQEHKVSSDFILEWRALTVCLLDELAKIIWDQLNLSSIEFPLAKILQGGTWSAGRKIAKELRADGGPPFKIKSDGTVF